jgi:hypothetical protein
VKAQRLMMEKAGDRISEQSRQTSQRNSAKHSWQPLSQRDTDGLRPIQVMCQKKNKVENAQKAAFAWQLCSCYPTKDPSFLSPAAFKR